MARWQPVPIVGGAYSDETKPWSAQDTVNWIPEVAERPQGRSDAMLRGAPGLSVFCNSMEAAPVRGLHDVEGLLLAVCGSGLYRIAPNGSASFIGLIPGVGRVSMTHNQIDGGHEVAIGNGSSGYVYSTKTGELTQITDDGFPGMVVGDFVDGYIAGVEPSGRYWYHSDLRKAAEYNTLDRQDAEAVPDRIVGLIVTHREVMVMGRRSGQFFRNTGAAQGTFQNANGTEMEVGLASPFAIARLDNTVYWLGHDGIVYRLNGNQPQRVSVGPIEQAIAKCDIRKAFAFTFEDRGHKIFYLTFPDGHTWGYDVWTNEWHRRESDGLTRWRLSALVKSNGIWIGGDYANGQLYRLAWDVNTEAGAPLKRRRVTGVLHDSQNALSLLGLELVFDTGRPGSASYPMPGPPAALRIIGNMPNRTLGASANGRYIVTGGYPPYEVTIGGGAMPTGITLLSDGRYTGTYAEEGDFDWTVRAEDSEGNVAMLDDAARVSGPIPYDALFRYKVENTGPGGSLAYAAADLDDSGWPEAQGGFGSPESAALAGHTVHTEIAGGSGKVIWLRKRVELPGPLRIDIFNDDGCQIFWNGERIKPTSDEYFNHHVIIPADKVTGDDVVALRVIDCYVYNYDSNTWTPGGSPNIYAALEISQA